MNTLVLFYSLEGDTKFISQILAKELGADLFEIETKKAYPTTGFKKFFLGGKSVIFKEQPKLKKAIELNTYDAIVIGTPVWAGSYAAPIHTIVKQYKFAGKKVAFFACHASGSAGNCFSRLKEGLPDNQFVGEIEFTSPLKSKEENAKKAEQWAKSLNF